MRKHFAQVFWGMLLVFLDFSFNGFDLLVDGIGYLFIAAGCAGLSVLSQRFNAARILCFVLAILWLIGLMAMGEISIVIGLLATVTNCMMIWQLLGGIIEFASQNQRRDLATRAENRRLMYVVIILISTLLSFALSGSRDAAPLAIPIVVSMLVLTVMILHLIHRVKVEIAT